MNKNNVYDNAESEVLEVMRLAVDEGNKVETEKYEYGSLKSQSLSSLQTMSESTVDGELKVIKVTRIMHPAYRSSNMWFGNRNPWNRWI